MRDNQIQTYNNNRIIFKTFILIDYILENYRAQYKRQNLRDEANLIYDLQEYIMKNIWLTDDTILSPSNTNTNTIIHSDHIIDKIYLYLHLIKNRKIISDMNIEIIFSHLEKIQKILKEYSTELSKIDYHNNPNSQLLASVDKNIKDNISIINESIKDNIHNDDIYKGQIFINNIKDKSNNTINQKDIITDKYKKSDKDVLIYNNTKIKDIPNTQSDNKIIKDNINQKDFSKKQVQRRDSIYKIIQKGEVNIKDISSKIIGCSEKTILRELQYLLDTNMIVRIGEKRWSRYRIA